MRVHFRLRDAARGRAWQCEEGEGKTRVFLLGEHDFIAIEEGEDGNELIIDFEYRQATLSGLVGRPANGKKNAPVQKDLSAIAENRILAIDNSAMLGWINELRKTHIKAKGEAADYSRLRAHLNRYAARNTFDYFFHSQGPPRVPSPRSLDFYIKNEVMHLDDIAELKRPHASNSTCQRLRSFARSRQDHRFRCRSSEDFRKNCGLRKSLWWKQTTAFRSASCPSSFS